MDRFSEQLVTKQSTGKDMFLRGLLLAAAMLLVGAFVFFLGGFGLWILVIALSAAVIWGLVWIIQGTFVEYEYIVTNDDLDIDKIIGKRKRKRLITVSLRSVKEIAGYTPDKEITADVSVIAHDESGIDMYYVISETEKYGDLAVIFNPDKRNLYNMIGGFSPAVKSRYSELYRQVAPADEVIADDGEQ